MWVIGDIVKKIDDSLEVKKGDFRQWQRMWLYIKNLE